MKYFEKYKAIMNSYDKCNLMIDVYRESEDRAMIDRNPDNLVSLEGYKLSLVGRLKQLKKDCIIVLEEINSEIHKKEETVGLIGSKILFNQKVEFEILLASVNKKLKELNNEKIVTQRVSLSL